MCSFQEEILLRYQKLIDVDILPRLDSLFYNVSIDPVTYVCVIPSITVIGSHLDGGLKRGTPKALKTGPPSRIALVYVCLSVCDQATGFRPSNLFFRFFICDVPRALLLFLLLSYLFFIGYKSPDSTYEFIYFWQVSSIHIERAQQFLFLKIFDYLRVILSISYLLYIVFFVFFLFCFWRRNLMFCKYDI